MTSPEGSWRRGAPTEQLGLAHFAAEQSGDEESRSSPAHQGIPMKGGGVEASDGSGAFLHNRGEVRVTLH
jgi:hypothetical protein